MLIDFDNIGETILDGFNGGEKFVRARISNDGAVKVMRGALVPGASIGAHTHSTSSEILYVLSGAGTAILDGVPERLSAGLCHYCPKGHTHTLINDGADELIFIAVVPEQ